MQIIFLGTGSQYPSKDRGVSCTALKLDNGEVWLFDCGEGSQIQLQKCTVRPARISKIFITHLHGDHLFGLPGLMCSIGSWSPDKRDTIEIYGPAGIRNYLLTNLLLSYSQFEQLGFTVNELIISECNQTDQWKDWSSFFPSSVTLKHPSELRGRDIEPDSSGLYHCFENSLITVKAGFIKHRVPSYGYVIEEKSSPGRLNVDKLAEYGVLPGPLYGQLKSGHAITTLDGKIIEPGDVVGLPIIGRKVTILGDTCDSNGLLSIAMDSDVLVHEATLQSSLKEKAVENGHSTPDMAAKFAKQINTKTLILTHFSQRYGKANQRSDNKSQDSDTVDILLEEAKSVAGDEFPVLIAEDLMEFNVKRTMSN
ncbi:Zinc phosphodiesterase ELAC protein 1 [Chamberlinius hualienensis]